jgi:hypothetical protein
MRHRLRPRGNNINQTRDRSFPAPSSDPRCVTQDAHQASPARVSRVTDMIIHLSTVAGLSARPDPSCGLADQWRGIRGRRPGSLDSQTPPTRPPLRQKFAAVTPRPHDDANHGRWVVDHHRDELIREVVGAERKSTRWFKRLLGITEPADDAARIFRVSFAELQRMKLRQLQIRLVNHAVSMSRSDQEPEGWQERIWRNIVSSCC